MQKFVILGLAAFMLSGCETTDGGDGYLTHSSHSITAAERAAIQSGMQTYLKIPVSLSALKASYDLNAGSVVICGNVSANGTPPVPFAGTLAAPDSGVFVPLRTPGQGRDPARIARVRAFCSAAQISI